MEVKVYWSSKAEKQFQSIVEYLETTWGINSASKFINSIFEFIEILSDFPEIGTLEHSELNIRGFVVVKQITVFYQIRKNKIVILNLYDNRQNPKKKRFLN